MKKLKKKLLIFTGSPRENGNSTILAREAAKGARRAGAEVEIINLAELKINPCLACNRCRHRGPGKCIQEDDLQKIFPKLPTAEAIILANPVYWFNINSQTKLFIDRWYAFGSNHYACFKGKKVGIILTFADKDVFSSGGINALRSYQDIFNYLRAEITGLLYTSASKEGEVKKNSIILKEAFNLGREIVS